MSAQINPGGRPATYQFEYGTSASYGSKTTSEPVGAGHAPVTVSMPLSGLQADTVYHFRAVAHSESGTVPGGDRSFTTFPTPVLALPDGRGYEMVTPVENHNANVDIPVGSSDGHENGFTTELPMQAAADGSAVAYVGEPSVEGNGSSGEGGGNEYLATRGPSGGWTQRVVQPPGDLSPRYVAFSSDLSTGILTSDEPLAAGVPGQYEVLYSRAMSDGGYDPFFTTTPPHRTPQEFSSGFDGVGEQIGKFYAGASSDFSHLLFEANDALTTNAVDGGQYESNLYESADGQLRLVNVLPNGTTEANATFGSEPTNREEGPGDEHVISADGSRIFWTDLNTEDLYVRENNGQPESPVDGEGNCTVPADACTVQVDKTQGPEAGGGGLYWTASSDGSKVFFTDCRKLTGDSTAVLGEEGCGRVDGEPGLTGNDLYEYDVSSGHLTDLTVDGKASDPLGANVQSVVGSSENGEYVYFGAYGDLAEGAISGQLNLYLWHDGVTTFVAAAGGVLSNFPSWLGDRSAEVTPDGHSLVFVSGESLTGYPNGNAAEVYVYDADSNQLACASCDPSGEPPSVAESNGLLLAAASLPDSASSTYSPRVISEDGSRVFFDSREPLVSGDTNGKVDVYEWERDGAGECQRQQGCIYLLSGGTNSTDSFLLDASANGDDVFIITRAQLVPQDKNENYNLYDVRVGAAQPPVASECSGTGCQGVPAAPPTFATPPSVTFSGVGNFTPVPQATVKAKKKTKAKKKRTKAKKKTKKKKKSKASKSNTRQGSGKKTMRSQSGRGGR